MNKAEKRRRVVLADDDVLLREGLASLLERSGFEVVGQADDGAQLIRLVREQKPELALVDIRMPPDHSTEGLDAAREIRAEFPETGIVLLSAHVEVEHAMEVLEGGDRTGYLLKSRVTDVEDFIDTLERVAKGGSVVDPALVQELVGARRKDGRTPASQGCSGSPREPSRSTCTASFPSSLSPRPRTITAGSLPWLRTWRLARVGHRAGARGPGSRSPRAPASVRNL